MDLSRKLLFAVCASAAFVAGIVSCTVEDRDVEEKKLFVCLTSADCLEGSICQGQNEAKGIEGRCVRREQMELCLDTDGDGFYHAAPEAPDGADCSFSKGIDPDDNDKDVYPGAPEYCDGKDNSGDGCIDGKCAEEGKCSGDDKTLCERLTETCLGPVGTPAELLENTLCDPRAIGMRVCLFVDDENNLSEEPGEGKHAEFVYALPVGQNGVYTYKKYTRAEALLDSKDLDNETLDGVSCPVAGKFKRYFNGSTERVPYSENEEEDRKSHSNYSQFCGIDLDCNGMNEEGDTCKKCDAASLPQTRCFVDTGASVTPAGNNDTCKVAPCGCFGEYSCTDHEGNTRAGTGVFCIITINGKQYSFGDTNSKKANKDMRDQMVDDNKGTGVSFDCEE